MCTNRIIFLQAGPQKMPDLYILGLEDGSVSRINIGRIPTTRYPNQNSAELWRIFSSKKVIQQIGRKESMQAVCLRMRRLQAFLYLAAQNFKILKIQDQN